MDIMNRVRDEYNASLELILDASDPRTRDWFMVYRTPVYVWAATLWYLIFALRLGPSLMKNRKPFELRNFMIVYNLFLVCLSAYMTFEILYSAYLNSYHPICETFSSKINPYRPSELRMAQVRPLILLIEL